MKLTYNKQKKGIFCFQKLLILKKLLILEKGVQLVIYL